MKIGLFFGSFNPIHKGHISIASYIKANADVDEIWFVVSPQNPLKKISDLLPQQHRLEMVKIAVKDIFYCKASDVEFHLPMPSYTIDTLNALSDQYPKHTWILIMGSDTVASLPKWKDFEKIMDNYLIYTYPRPDYKIEDIAPNEHIKSFENVPLLDISATMIRELAENDKSFEAFLDLGVYHYIVSHGLFDRNRALS